MADEVEMIPVAGAEPPKANPLAKPAATKVETIKLNPVARQPGAAPAPALKPGLKLPPKPGLAAGIKLPPKPGATVSALRPGLKLPTQTALKPGLKLPTQTALKPGVKLPSKPIIRKPGATVAAAPLPKPLPKPVAPAAAAPKPEAPAVAKPAETSAAAKPAAPAVSAPVNPIAVDAQGVGKLPTVSAATIARGEGAPDVSALPKPMEALKSVTQKLKGLTQEIPQQAILHKTGIIAEASGVSEAQKEAAKHKTARISLSDAMGVAPVKNEAAPMKTIRIKRPVNIPGATSSLTPPAKPAQASAPASADAVPAPVTEPAAPAAENAAKAAPAATVTQRKTLKIARPGGVAVRPGGKFGIKRPGQAATTAQAAPDAASTDAAPADAAVADIPDIPTNVPAFSAPVAAAPAAEGPAWLWTLSTIIQAAACVAIGALAWFLYTNTQTQYF